MNRLILYLSALILLFGADSLVARNRPLNIGSYNIRCNNPGDGENAWPNRKERVKALILFHEYDVVGVQEARPEQMEDLQQMPGFASVGVGRDGEAGGEFSAIFYRVDRIQVLDSGTFWLSETPEKVSKGWDAALNRICTWAKMKDRATRRVFYFFNTHFDHIGPVARHKSAELLVARIRETVGEKYPVFCSGDSTRGPGATGRGDAERFFRCGSRVADAALYAGLELHRFRGEGSGAVDEKRQDRLPVRQRPRDGAEIRHPDRFGRAQSSVRPLSRLCRSVVEIITAANGEL